MKSGFYEWKSTNRIWIESRRYDTPTRTVFKRKVQLWHFYRTHQHAILNDRFQIIFTYSSTELSNNKMLLFSEQIFQILCIGFLGQLNFLNLNSIFMKI